MYKKLHELSQSSLNRTLNIYQCRYDGLVQKFDQTSIHSSICEQQVTNQFNVTVVQSTLQETDWLKVI